MSRPAHPLKRIVQRLALVTALALLPLPVSVVAVAHAQSPGGEKRLALVVGNAAYKQFPLDNPVRDARAISAELRKLGFEVLTFENIGAAKFRRELANFAKRIKTEDGASVFYYAGHGIGVRGRNLLVPVDAQITTEESAFAEPVDVDFHLLSQIEGGKKQTNLIILDACRDDPFAGRDDGQKKRGLVEMGAKNSLIAFATRPGDVAEDGELGKNGMFTSALLAQMEVPGLEVRSMFTKVRAEVLQKTRQRQYPYVNDLLVREFYLRPGSVPKADQEHADTEQRRIEATIAALRAKQEQEVKRLLAELAVLRRERDDARRLADLARDRVQLASASPVIAPLAMAAQSQTLDTTAVVARSAETAPAANDSAVRPQAQQPSPAERTRIEDATAAEPRNTDQQRAATAAEAERKARDERARIAHEQQAAKLVADAEANKAAEAAKLEREARAAEAARAADAARLAAAQRAAEAALATRASREAEAARLAEEARTAEAAAAAAKLARANEAALREQGAANARRAQAEAKRELEERDARQRLVAEAKAAEERYQAALEKDRVAQLQLLRVEESPQLAALGITPEAAPAVRDRAGDIFARGVRLPADLRIVPPAENVPAECRGFLGAWGHGRWDLKRTAEIWIEQIGKDCSVRATYGRGGVSLIGEAPTYQRVSGRIEGGELRLELAGGQRITMRLTREKTVNAEWSGGRERSVAEFEPISPRPDAPTLAYALEDEHDGAAPTTQILAGNFNRSLPREVPGATTISTLELRALLEKRKDVVLVDAISGETHRGLPGAMWLPDIGQAAGFGSRTYALGAKELNEIHDSLAKASGDDVNRPVVVFERSSIYGWLGYHGTLRVLGLGYQNVYWYRGGLDAWHDAGFLVAQAGR